MRSPGGLPYHAAEDRESGDAGLRVQPRIFDTGFLLDGTRLYYPSNVSVKSCAQLERELQRDQILRFDLIKNYVRLPERYLRRSVEFGHQYGICLLYTSPSPRDRQ